MGVSASDLLICRGNGNAALVGRGFYPVNDMPGVAFPDTIIAVRLDARLFDPRYVQAIWNSDSVREQVNRHTRTTNGTFKINQQAIESVQLDVPPLGLQEAFANRVQVLKATRIGTLKHQLHLDTLFASLQHRAFTGAL